MKIGNGKFNETIRKNSVKIKVSIVVILIVLLIFRFYLNSEKEIGMNLNITDSVMYIFSLFELAVDVLPYFLIPLETTAVFLNKKAAVMISIISILFSIPLIFLYGSTIFPFILAGLDGEGWDGISIVIAEFISNTIFCVAAGILMVIKEA